jgi:hypothetical protein
VEEGCACSSLEIDHKDHPVEVTLLVVVVFEPAEMELAELELAMVCQRA